MNLTKSIILLLSAVLFSSCAQTSSLTGGTPPTSQEMVIAERIFELVNTERAKVGAPRLKGQKHLNQMAQTHSKSQASSGASNLTGTEKRAQNAMANHKAHRVAEIVYYASASSSDPAKSAVSAWKSNSNQRKLLLGSWTSTGVGMYKTESGDLFVTMLLTSP